MIGRRKKRKKSKEKSEKNLIRADVSENSTSASIQRSHNITPDLCTELHSVLIFSDFIISDHCNYDFQCRCCGSVKECKKYQIAALRLTERNFHDDLLLRLGYDIFGDEDMFFE